MAKRKNELIFLQNHIKQTNVNFKLHPLHKRQVPNTNYTYKTQVQNRAIT